MYENDISSENVAIEIAYGNVILNHMLEVNTADRGFETHILK